VNRTYVIGLLALFGIVAFRGVAGWYKNRRLKNWWLRANAALERNDLTAAEAALRNCVKLLPTVSVMHRALGNVLARRGKLKEAEEHLRFGAELEPANPAGHVDLGFFLALCHTNRGEDAIQSFSKAVSHAPDLREKLAQDPRLVPLHGYAEWQQLVSG
jgi:predicted Zn-dependent protease